MNNLCGLINATDNRMNLSFNNSTAVIEFDKILTEYCYAEKDGGKKECFSYEVLVSSIFIKLLNHFKSCNGEGNLEDNKLAQYAILWLCHKLNKNLQNGISNLKDIYDVYIKGKESDIQKIVDVEAYNIYKDLINKKGDFMNKDIKEMSKFYEALQILCKMYTKIDESKSNCTKCLDDAQKFADEYEKINGNYNDTEDRTYKKILLTLFDDYDNLKKKCDNDQSINFPTLSPIKTPDNFAQNFENRSSSSSIASTLIPVLLTFSIPFFLGIAYKYSLFGFGKRSQKQYLRKRLKK